MISNLSPHGFTPEATSAALEHDIRTWLFHSGGNVTEGAPTLTYLRVVGQPQATESDGFAVVSATTGPAPVSRTQPVDPASDLRAWRGGRVLTTLAVGADGSVDPAVPKAPPRGPIGGWGCSRGPLKVMVSKSAPQRPVRPGCR